MADFRTNHGGMFTNAAGEYQRVKAAKHRPPGSLFPGRPDTRTTRSPPVRAGRRWQARFACRWKCRKHPASRIDDKAAAQERVRPCRGDPSDKATRRGRITAAGTHYQAVERREAHGSGDAAPVMECAKAGAATQVGDDDACIRKGGFKCGQYGGNVFVGQTVESVMAYTLIGKAPGYGEALRDRGLRAVKRSIKAGHLRQ